MSSSTVAEKTKRDEQKKKKKKKKKKRKKTLTFARDAAERTHELSEREAIFATQGVRVSRGHDEHLGRGEAIAHEPRVGLERRVHRVLADEAKKKRDLLSSKPPKWTRGLSKSSRKKTKMKKRKKKKKNF